MIRVLTTKYGQLIAKVDAAKNTITVYDGRDMRALASAAFNEGDNVPKLIRHLSSALSMRRKLEQRSIKLLVAPGVKEPKVLSA